MNLIRVASKIKQSVDRFARSVGTVRSRVTYAHFLFAAVFVAAGLSFWVSYIVHFDFEVPPAYSQQRAMFLPIVAIMKLCVFFLLRSSVKNRRSIGSGDKVFLVCFSAVCSIILLLPSILGPSLHIPRGIVATDFFLTPLLVGTIRQGGRLVTEQVIPYFVGGGMKGRRALIVGAGDLAEALIREIRRSPESDLRVVAIFDDDPSKQGMVIQGVRVRGTVNDMESYLRRNPVDEAIMAVQSPDPFQMTRINEVLGGINVQVRTLPPLLEIVAKSAILSDPPEIDITRALGNEEIMVESAQALEEASGPIPVARPTLPEIEDVFKAVEDSYRSGMVTVGKIVTLFEDEVRRFTDVEHAIAVSTCSSGLMLAFAAMDLPEGAEVVVPSFTFAATAQVLLWNRLTPVYVDCLPGTMTIDPDEVVKAISSKTAAIYPVAVFGLPPDLDRLEEISREYDIPLICDSAQGMGSTYKGRPAGGFGLCEVFSLSPGKVITAMEGGVVTTNDSELAKKLGSMRDYGKAPDGEELIFKGLSARMIEFDAAVGLLSLRNADSLISARRGLIRNYRERLKNLTGCAVQEFPPDRTSSGSHFAFRIGKNAAMTRDEVWDALKAHDIQTKRYFYPPVHSQRAFTTRPYRTVGELPNTWDCCMTTLALPLYSHMTDKQQDRVCRAVESLLDGNVESKPDQIFL